MYVRYVLIIQTYVRAISCIHSFITHNYYPLVLFQKWLHRHTDIRLRVSPPSGKAPLSPNNKTPRRASAMVSALLGARLRRRERKPCGCGVGHSAGVRVGKELFCPAPESLRMRFCSDHIQHKGDRSNCEQVSLQRRNTKIEYPRRSCCNFANSHCCQ